MWPPPTAERSQVDGGIRHAVRGPSGGDRRCRRSNHGGFILPVPSLSPEAPNGSMKWLRRHGLAIELGGALLVGVGILFVTGRWQLFFLPLQRRFAGLGWPQI